MNTLTPALLCLLVAAASASHLAERIGAKNCTGVDGCCKLDEGSKEKIDLHRMLKYWSKLWLFPGDCDEHSDCCSGLKCNYDWGFATDLCEAGKTELLNSQHWNINLFALTRSHNEGLFLGSLGWLEFLLNEVIFINVSKGSVLQLRNWFSIIAVDMLVSVAGHVTV